MQNITCEKFVGGEKKLGFLTLDWAAGRGHFSVGKRQHRSHLRTVHACREAGLGKENCGLFEGRKR